MTTIEKWKTFSGQARAQLKVAETLKYGESFLQFNYEPSFEAYFNILIIWKGNEGRWFKNVWDIATDYEHYFERDNKPRALVIDKQASINRQSGKLPSNEIQALQNMVRELRIAPIIDQLRMFTLDGAMHSISLGIDECLTVFSWHTLPDEWKQLQTLAEYLVGVCQLAR